MANNYGVVFNGRRIVHPGAYDATNAQSTVAVSPGSSNTPIIVGTAEAGESGKVVWYNDVEQIRRDYKGGDIVTAAELMFSPTPEGGGGASIVGLLVVNPTTRATVTTGGLAITALEYGEGGNKIQARLQDGTLAGTKKLTTYRWDNEKMQVLDNLGATIRIQYTGTLAYAGLTITATKLETKVGADKATAVADISLDLTNPRFATLEDIVKHINSLSGYSATFVDYNRNYNLASTKLDALVETAIKAAPHTVLAVKGDIEMQTAKYSEMVSIVASGSVANFDFKYLTGGVKGEAPASWATHFNTIKNQFSDVLVVLSSAEAVQAEALAHIQQMEQRNQKQMLFTGGAVGESVTEAKRRASVLNSSRAVLAYPGIFHKSIENGKKALPAYLTSAMIAGRVCGVDPSEPITFDYFNLVGLERELLAGSPDVDDLLVSGVCTLEKVQNGAIRLVQGITTYMGANNSIFREISVRRGSDALSGTIQSAMENTFVGQKGLRATASAVETKAIDILEQAIKNEEITAYQNIIVRFIGSLVYVDFEVAYVEPINYVLITSHFVADTTIGNIGE